MSKVALVFAELYTNRESRISIHARFVLWDSGVIIVLAVGKLVIFSLFFNEFCVVMHAVFSANYALCYLRILCYFKIISPTSLSKLF